MSINLINKKLFWGRNIQNKKSRSISKERLDLCLSVGNLAWWEMNVKTGKVTFNDNKVKMLGYSVDNFKDADYKTFMDLVHPDDYNRVMQDMKDHLEDKKETYDVEYRIKAKNGMYKWYYDKGSVVERDQNNKPILVKGVVIDISKIKLSENLEKLSNQILHILNKSEKRVNQIHDILILIKKSHDFEAVGIRIKDDKHYPYYETNGFPANFIKKANHICTNSSPDTSKKQHFECMCGKIINSKIDTNLPFFTTNGSFWTNDLSDILIKNPNNIRKYFSREECINAGYKSIALIPIRTNDDIVGLIQINDKRKNILSTEIIRTLEGIGFSIGIAFARDQAIKKLQVNERRVRLAQRAANIGSWDWNIKTGELTWSEKIEPMFGFKKGKFKGTYETFLKSVHPEDRDLVVKSVNNCLKHKKKYAIEHRIIWPDGTIRWVLERGDVIRDQKDEPKRMLGVVQDITLKKEMEKELKQRKEKLEEMVEERTAELIKANKKLKEEINERKKAEKYIERAKENLRNVIDSASEIIISFDMNKRISTWNKTAQKITGYKNIEVLNRSVKKLDVFYDSENIEEHIERVCKKTNIPRTDIILKTKDNEKKIIRISGTNIIGEKNECLGALFIGRNITHEKELHGKLVEGSSYLIMNESNKSSIEMFKDLVLSGYNGLFITRGSPIIIKSNFPKTKNLELILLSTSKIKGFKTISEIDVLINKIKEFNDQPKNAIILLDGIHYLITKFSFEKFIESLYEINDVITSHKSMFFMRVDPQTISENQLGIIKNEFLIFPTQKVEGLIINDDEYHVLKYIHEQNTINSKVSHKKITRKFKISYPTASKRIEILENNGLIITKKEGKLKNIYITEKGKSFLNIRVTT